MYNLTNTTPRNIQPCYNIAPTTQVGVITQAGDDLTHSEMRWWLVPSWWSSPGASCRHPQIRLYFGIGQNQEKCALLKLRELRAARFVRKCLYKNGSRTTASLVHKTEAFDIATSVLR